MFRSTDFWPPVTGGWRRLEGHLVSVDAVVSHIETILPGTRKNPEFLGNEDESDWYGFLEDQLGALAIPVPEQVLALGGWGQRTRPKLDLPPDYYALWSSRAVAGSQALANLLQRTNAPSARAFEVWDRLRLAMGAGLVIWLAAFVGICIFAWLRFTTLCCANS